MDGDRVLQVMRLIWAVDHQLHSVSKRMERSIGLTVPQRMALLLIGQRPGILAKEIAELLHLHRGTVSGVLWRLETGGYLKRTRHESDARQATLALTAKGRAINAHRSGTFEEAVRQVLDRTPKGRLAAAEEVLTLLATELESIASQVGQAATMRTRARRARHK
jgi:DNA-binding MarR family transcriptional regulator